LVSRTCCAFAQIDECHRLPHLLSRQELATGRRSRLLRQPLRFRAKVSKDRMPQTTPEPILRVPVVRLTAMQDRVPVAAFGRVEVLADGVRFVEEIVMKPEAGETCQGEVAITDSWREQ